MDFGKKINTMNVLRYILVALLNIGIAWSLSAQSLESVDIDQCYTAAKAHHPSNGLQALNQEAYMAKSKELELEKRPSIQWNTEASIQSEALTIQFPIPNIEAIELPLYRVQSAVEGSYVILDGGANHARQNTNRMELEMNLKAIESDLYPLNQKIEQLYFGILQLDMQDSILLQAQSTLELKEANVASAIEYGVLLPSAGQRIKVEILGLENQLASIQNKRAALVDMLSYYTGLEIGGETLFIHPSMENADTEMTIQRPEIELMKSTQQLLESKVGLLDAVSKPKLSAFAKAGIGQPNPLNLVDADWSPYAIGGMKFIWPITDWGKKDYQHQGIKVEQAKLANKIEQFEFQLNALRKQYIHDRTLLDEKIVRQQAIVDLQEQILNEESAALENGTSTETEYLTQLNAALSARLQIELLKLQKIQKTYEYITQMGR